MPRQNMFKDRGRRLALRETGAIACYRMDTNFQQSLFPSHSDCPGQASPHQTMCKDKQLLEASTWKGHGCSRPLFTIVMP